MTRPDSIRSDRAEDMDLVTAGSDPEWDPDLADELGLTATFSDSAHLVDEGDADGDRDDGDRDDGAEAATAARPRVVSLRRRAARSAALGESATDPRRHPSARVGAVVQRRRVLVALSAAAAVVLLVLGVSALIRSVLGPRPGAASQAASTLSLASAAAPLTSRLHVEASSRAYLRANLATLGQDVLEAPGTAYPFAPDSPDAPPVTTSTGLNGCLFALGELDADRIAVDLASYEGQPAAIVVVIDGGLKQVYAVERTCTKGNPHILAGPFPMT